MLLWLCKSIVADNSLRIGHTADQDGDGFVVLAVEKSSDFVLSGISDLLDLAVPMPKLVY